MKIYEKSDKINRTNNAEPIAFVIWSIERMHYKVKKIDNEDLYYIYDRDNKRVFGDGYKVTPLVLRQFYKRAWRYKRRNGLKKLQEYLPELVSDIKSNRWLWN